MMLPMPAARIGSPTGHAHPVFLGLDRRRYDEGGGRCNAGDEENDRRYGDQAGQTRRRCLPRFSS